MVTSEIVWDEPNDVDDKWVQFIDDNVLASKLTRSPLVHLHEH